MPSFGAKSSTEKKVYNEVTAGDRNCYIYFDCEFTGLKKNTDLISIGLIDSDGKSFYAEFTDYRKELISNPEWFEEHIFNNLSNPDTVLEGDNWTITGTTKEIRQQLMFWLDERCKDHIVQFVSDVCHYDFVLLIDLLTLGGEAISLPQNMISPCCIDLNQDIATSLYRDNNVDNTNFVPARVAFDISRLEYANAIKNNNLTENDNIHNALTDAKIIRLIHQDLWDLTKKEN